MSSVARTATLKQTLVAYDGPQVALLKSSRKLDMLAVAIERPGYELPFFACEIRDKTLSRYLTNKIDLKYAFQFADYRKYYFFDWCKMEDRTVRLQLASEVDVANEDYLPEAGFFARDHSHPFVQEKLKESARHIFNIDGAWAANDFSRFYGKIADLYAFLYVLERKTQKALSAVDLSVVKDSISQHFWRGGGSYVAFYDTISERVDHYDPLSVSRIKYASPGEIVLRGRAEIFVELDDMVDTFDDNFREIQECTKNITAILNQHKLRRAGRNVRISNKLEDQIKAISIELSSLMEIEGEEILELCDNNVLVFAKVILSFYRRAKDFYLFHAEGRVQSEG